MAIFYAKAIKFDSQNVESVLSTLQAKLVSDLTVWDLVEMTQDGHAHGLYFFYCGDQLMYIGTCRSKVFMTRLMYHLDSGDHAWMNTLTKRVAKKFSLSRTEAVHKIMEECSLKVVSVPRYADKNKVSRKEATKITQEKTVLLKLENILRSSMQPTLNARSSTSADPHRLLQMEEMEQNVQEIINEIEQSIISEGNKK